MFFVYSRTASSKEHECVTVILLQTKMSNKHSRTTRHQFYGTQRSFSERGKSQNFLLPRLALRTRFALRAKCRVRIAWLIKRLLCRLFGKVYWPQTKQFLGFASHLLEEDEDLNFRLATISAPYVTLRT